MLSDIVSTLTVLATGVGLGFGSGALLGLAVHRREIRQLRFELLLLRGKRQALAEEVEHDFTDGEVFRQARWFP